MTKEEEDISNLLVAQVQAKLKLEDSTTSAGLGKEDAVSTTKLQQELDKAGFVIFQSLSDYGFFSWKPTGSQVSLSSVSAKYIQKHIDVAGKPDDLVPIARLQIPHRFSTSLKAQEFENSFPYGQYDIACLHVASKHRKVDMNDMDFAFGGSTLEMLANKDASDPYYAMRVPGTKMILVVKRKEYVQNYADPGFQFERFVVGKPSSITSSVEYVEHMHTMKVGSFKVLFRAETDALDKDELVEIKFSNPRYWGTKVMFQMISSGSTKLCAGIKSQRVILSRIDIKPLSVVAKDALEFSDIKMLEKNIVDGMHSLKNELGSKTDGDGGRVFRVSFLSGKLKLSPASARNVALLPPPEVVRELV